MKRYRLIHCRDDLVNPDYRWDVWEVETDDPKRPPEWRGYGSYDTCREFILGLIELRDKTGIKGG